jgi:hypothetical protein
MRILFIREHDHDFGSNKFKWFWNIKHSVEKRPMGLSSPMALFVKDQRACVPLWRNF